MSRILVATTLVLGVAVAYVGPAAAAPAWRVVPSASPAGPPNGRLFDVACPSGTSCFAVGAYVAGSAGSLLLAEHWDGAHWSIMSLPMQSGFFRSIACPSTTSCVAVASAGSGSTSAIWNGTTWSLVPVAGTVALFSVACSSATSCFAVGAQGASTLIEQWDGSTWSIVASPNVDGAASSGLDAVSCASATSCFAVGGSGGDIDPQTLIEQWNGTSWSIVDSPTPVSGDPPVLSDVSCSSETSCFAAGYFFPTDGPESTLIEQWDGTSWSIVDSPNVSGASNNFLLGVSCSSATSCFAVGASARPSVSASGLLERWDGTSWSISSSPAVDPSYSEFRGVACPSSTNCFAVGERGPAASPAVLAEHWNGSSWSATAYPAANPAPPNATLAGVSCATATTCFGVGQYTSSTGRVVTLIERPTGATWSTVASPNPAGAAVNMLSSVSCPSVTLCFAVGSSGSGGLSRTLIERWNGKAWSVIPSPNVTRAVKGLTPNVLTGVSCSSPTNCFAVGYSIYFSFRTVIVRWDGKTWTIVASPNRSTAKTAESVLQGVSCPTATSCFAVGRSSDSTSNQPSTFRSLTERWNGIAWSIVPSPNAVTGVGELAGVSCSGAKVCVAVGSASRSFARKSLIATWNGTAWTRVTSVDPSAATNSTLSGVSCASPTTCIAVGSASGSSQLNQTLVKTLAGGHWTNGSGATLPNARNSRLNAVSCPKATSCTAVGGFDTSGAPLTLVERYS